MEELKGERVGQEFLRLWSILIVCFSVPFYLELCLYECVSPNVCCIIRQRVVRYLFRLKQQGSRLRQWIDPTLPAKISALPSSVNVRVVVVAAATVVM